MTDIPGIISGSTIPSQDTWNEYIKVTANMTKTAIKLRSKKHLHQNMMKHFAMKLMRETLGAKDDLSEEMIENMGMEEMLSNLEGDYKIETLEKQIESNRKRVAARVAAMSAVELENYRESNQKRVAARVRYSSRPTSRPSRRIRPSRCAPADRGRSVDGRSGPPSTRGRLSTGGGTIWR